MLPYLKTPEDFARFQAWWDAKACEMRKEFMKNPPLINDSQPRVLVFSPQADEGKAIKSRAKIIKSLKNDFKEIKKLKPTKIPKKFLCRPTDDEIADLRATGQIYKLPILQSIADSVLESLEKGLI